MFFMILLIQNYLKAIKVHLWFNNLFFIKYFQQFIKLINLLFVIIAIKKFRNFINIINFMFIKIFQII